MNVLEKALRSLIHYIREINMTILYANPYDTSYFGFYFDSLDKFNGKLSLAKFEEVEIEYHDGDNPKLFNAVGIYQNNVDIWFDELDQYSDTDDEATAIIFLIDFMDLNMAIQRHTEVVLHKGSIVDYASELIDELYPVDDLPDIIKHHIDYSGIARDMELNSEVAEINHDLWVTNCMEF
jgi:hypothetical protein